MLAVKRLLELSADLFPTHSAGRGSDIQRIPRLFSERTVILNSQVAVLEVVHCRDHPKETLAWPSAFTLLMPAFSAVSCPAE